MLFYTIATNLTGRSGSKHIDSCALPRRNLATNIRDLCGDRFDQLLAWTKTLVAARLNRLKTGRAYRACVAACLVFGLLGQCPDSGTCFLLGC